MRRELTRQMIKAVLFDLFETLITEVQPTRASSLAAALGLEQKAYRVEWKARRPRVVVGELCFAEALTQISHTLAGTVDATAIQRICQQRMQEKDAAYARMNDLVASLITGLTRRGVKLGVISNGFKEDVFGWPGCMLAPAFQCTAFSCEEGIAKPDPEIYLRAIHRLGVRSESTVYIGDGGDNELSGAEEAGLRAYHASWFVRLPSQKAAWPELAQPEDVMKLVTRASFG
jgi:HAD superfamily hydrolase (TIGR01549 family)